MPNHCVFDCRNWTQIFVSNPRKSWTGPGPDLLGTHVQSCRVRQTGLSGQTGSHLGRHAEEHVGGGAQIWRQLSCEIFRAGHLELFSGTRTSFEWFPLAKILKHLSVFLDCDCLQRQIEIEHQREHVLQFCLILFIHTWKIYFNKIKVLSYGLYLMHPIP